MQAASSRIRTSRSSNCSSTNSHRDFPVNKQRKRQVELEEHQRRPLLFLPEPEKPELQTHFFLWLQFSISIHTGSISQLVMVYDRTITSALTFFKIQFKNTYQSPYPSVIIPCVQLLKPLLSVLAPCYIIRHVATFTATPSMFLTLSNMLDVKNTGKSTGKNNMPLLTTTKWNYKCSWLSPTAQYYTNSGFFSPLSSQPLSLSS